MVAETTPVARPAAHEIPIETLRSMAVVLLVSYHVIGSDTGSGLEIGYPHVLRLFADFFVDVRMPLFAFIAGFVYALRSASLARYVHFVLGKFRRLFIPGVVAALSFAAVSLAMRTDFAVPIPDIWKTILMPYAHFWFLQAILVIFVVYGLIDALLGRKFSFVFLILSCVLYLGEMYVARDIFSVNGALYLLPYFLLGVVFNRYGGEIWADAERLTIILMCVAVFCALANMKELYETEHFSTARRDVQSLGFGLSVTALAFMWAPKLPQLEKLAPYAFTIYLYHVFGAVAVRMTLDFLGVTVHEILFAFGLAGGLLFPILLHEVLCRQSRLSALVLGCPARTADPFSRAVVKLKRLS